MSVFIASINSGSNGNCYYVGNDDEAVLIDVGLSCRETEKRMRRIGLNMERVKAIFISHEHGDHIKGMDVISRKYKLPVYITPATLGNCRNKPEQHLTFTFKAYEPVTIGAITVRPFPKFHDAIDPHSFVVESDGMKIGVFTDIGIPCEHLQDHFRECHAAFLEANYDEQMLANGRYPYHLKKRISSDEGHLSNTQALELFLTHKPGFMSHLFLSHLSKDNNDPQLALELFAAQAGKTLVAVASRYEESPVYEIKNAGNELLFREHHKPAKPQQIALF